jgi:hypothetical protein
MRGKALIAAGLIVLGAGCGQQSTYQGSAPSSETATRSSDESIPPVFTPPSQIQRRELGAESRKLDFLQEIRAADPQYQTIERALMNEQNELGIVLSRQVEMNDIPKLMRALLKQMAAQFPGQDLTIVAYAPSEPPLKIGTARLDASTREMTYTPARQL